LEHNLSKIVEIERRFVVDSSKLPDLGPSTIVSQGYFSVNPVVRVAIVEGGRCRVSFKGPGTIAREEYEYNIPKDQALRLIELAPWKIKREDWDLGEWEIRYYPDYDLWMAEIEMASEGQEVILPEWIWYEVTDEPKFNAAHLAKSLGLKLGNSL
jgi:adenylate cyclase